MSSLQTDQLEAFQEEDIRRSEKLDNHRSILGKERERKEEKERRTRHTGSKEREKSEALASNKTRRITATGRVSGPKRNEKITGGNCTDATV